MLKISFYISVSWTRINLLKKDFELIYMIRKQGSLIRSIFTFV